MYSVSHPPSSEPDRAIARRRAVSLALTVGAHLLLLLLLLRLAPPLARMSRSGGSLVTFDVAPQAQEQAARSRRASKTRHAASNPATPSQATIPPPEIQLPVKAAPWVLTPGLERFDVRQVPPTRQTASPSDASAIDEANGDSDSDRPVAYGPAGQPLYDAQWYREPTDTELRYYLKNARPGPGFGMIACRTVARFHVEDCIDLDETPGSGLARATREAAWQFLVLPPRIGGRMMVGSWVRIRIDYTERKER